MRWLIPRLDDFRRQQPEVDVQVSTAFTNEAGFNGTFDVAIRHTLERGEQFESVPVFSEYQTVIASPAMLEQVPLQGVEDSWRASSSIRKPGRAVGNHGYSSRGRRPWRPEAARAREAG